MALSFLAFFLEPKVKQKWCLSYMRGDTSVNTKITVSFCNISLTKKRLGVLSWLLSNLLCCFFTEKNIVNDCQIKFMQLLRKSEEDVNRCTIRWTDSRHVCLPASDEALTSDVNVTFLFQCVERWRTVSRKRRRNTSPPTSRATDCDNTQRLRHAVAIRDERENGTSTLWRKEKRRRFGAIPVRVSIVGILLRDFPAWYLSSRSQTWATRRYPTFTYMQKTKGWNAFRIKRWSSINRWFRLKQNDRANAGSSWRVVF